MTTLPQRALRWNVFLNFSVGFSDPYCMLGIMPGRLVNEDLSGVILSDEEDQGEKKEKKRSSLRRFSLTSSKKKKDKTVKELLPARLIKTTDVKANTLNPVWEEKFRL